MSAHTTSQSLQPSSLPAGLAPGEGRLDVIRSKVGLLAVLPLMAAALFRPAASLQRAMLAVLGFVRA
jgi:hypothetical protein